MKLLCWMHRKFRQNSHETLKALVMGQSSADDQHQYFQKASYGGRGFNNPQSGSRKSFNDDRYYDDEEEAEDEISDLFRGFLAIGTLGSPDQMMADPATPTFTISNITEKETEATENEFKLINDELEKVLLEDSLADSASRNSHVSSNGRSSHVSSNGRSSHVSSNGRSSHGSSVITLSGKPDDVAVAGAGGGTVCPLQGYLFGSAIDMSSTAGRKENRTSLGELFQRSKESGDHEKRSAEKEGEKSAIKIVKKKLKKKMLNASSRSSSTASGGDPSAPSETKLNKILQMFHRKVHPESPEGIVKNNKVSLRKKQAHEEEGDMAPDQDQDMLTLCPERARFLKQKIRRYRSQSNPFDSNNAANREQWIKTDADYLVLEL